jgi:hypothetical protein
MQQSVHEFQTSFSGLPLPRCLRTFEYSPFISNDLVKSNEGIVMIGVASAVISGVVIFHVAGATIHILLVLAAISLVLDFVRGARTV